MMRTAFATSAVIVVIVAIGCDAGAPPPPAPVPKKRVAVVAPVVPPVAIDAAVEDAAPRPIAPAEREKMERTLARCCGTKRGTLGPLFRELGIEIGEIGYDMVETPPAALGRQATGLAIELHPDYGEFGFNLDVITIEVPDEELCDDLEARLVKAWGPVKPWDTPARRGVRQQGANLTRHGASCLLAFGRTPTHDAAHCLRDERPMERDEIDVTRKCILRSVKRGCDLVRDRPNNMAGAFAANCVEENGRTWRTYDLGEGEPCAHGEEFFEPCPRAR